MQNIVIFGSKIEYFWRPLKSDKKVSFLTPPQKSGGFPDPPKVVYPLLVYYIPRVYTSEKVLKFRPIDWKFCLTFSYLVGPVFGKGVSAIFFAIALFCRFLSILGHFTSRLPVGAQFLLEIKCVFSSEQLGFPQFSLIYVKISRFWTLFWHFFPLRFVN
jgi:hypothetical protein